mgnify:CR=1 FL=1
MKKILLIAVSILFLNTQIFADIKENLNKLEKLFESGKITKKEYEKAKIIFYEMENVNSIDKNGKSSKFLRVNTYKNSKEKYEKNEIIFGDYRIYTHRPGGIKIRRLSNNKQLIVISDKFKVSYYNGGDQIFDVKKNLKELNISLLIQGVELLKWTGRYVEKHQASFFQITTTTNEAFHYYISLKNGKSVALNIKKFDKKIDKAVAKAKVRLASKHGITLEQIDYILKSQKLKKNKELTKILGQEINLIIEKDLDDTLNKTIGEELAAEFDSIIIEGMEQEFASAVDSAVQEAVEAGISAATARAAIAAIMEVYARGGTDEEAMAACRSHAGDAC